MAYLRRLALYGTGGATGLYLADKFLFANSIERNARTIFTGLNVIYDYKVRFNHENANEIHEKVATDIFNVCTQNGGLYIKFGQGIASMNHVLPPQYKEIFKTLHDRAPAVSFEDVVQVFKEDFGVHPDDLFDDFSREAVASASIAQVHTATIKRSGEKVAVKVQKPYIAKQMNWDLATYKLTVKVLEILFDLPMYWGVEFTEQNLRMEVDFKEEARNSELATKALKEAPVSLSSKVYVPIVNWDLTTKRVMTAEWCGGVQVTDMDAVRKMGFSMKQVMTTAIELFAHQIFCGGHVHCDPHPGNLLIRPKGTSYELILLDHGLYIHEPDVFRQSYCDFWVAMFMKDKDKMEQICNSWGIQHANTFASFQLMKPYFVDSNKPIGRDMTMEEVVEMQLRTKERIRSLLFDSALIPRELLFVGRNMNLMRSNNKDTGSSVNRVHVLAKYAARGAEAAQNAKDKGERTFLDQLGTLVGVPTVSFNFHVHMMLLSVMYTVSQAWCKINSVLFNRKVSNFEELLDKQMAAAGMHAMQKLGFVVNESTLDG